MFGTAFAYIALAFFMVRISLAAAIAAGDACLTGAGCFGAGGWAPAGTPASASARAKPAAGKIPEKLFIPILLDCGAHEPFDNANSVSARQHSRAGKTNKQPVLDDTGYRGQQSCQARRIGYPAEMGIDDPVAAIGDENVAIPALSNRHLPGNAGFRQMP